MIDQLVKFRAPIEVLPSENYYLKIKDADGVIHYFHKKHSNEYGNFEQGQYDGWSADKQKHEIT